MMQFQVYKSVVMTMFWRIETRGKMTKNKDRTHIHELLFCQCMAADRHCLLSMDKPRLNSTPDTSKHTRQHLCEPSVRFARSHLPLSGFSCVF